MQAAVHVQRALAVAMLLWCAACATGEPAVGADAVVDATDDTDDGNGVADGGDASDGPADIAADATASVCAGVLCDGHGRCIHTPTGPACVCDPGYVPAIGQRCLADTTCPVGQARVGEGCFAPAALHAWCEQACAAPAVACASDVALPAKCMPFCSGRFASGADCVVDCMGQLDEPGALAETICAGAARRFDSIDCRTLSACATPPQTPVAGCDAICEAAAGCGTLLDARWLLGGSLTECKLYCTGLATALEPVGRFAPLRDCLQVAASTCDPLALLACTVSGVTDVDTRLCSELATECGYIPGVWADEAACEAALASWSPGQRMQVGGCISFNNGEQTCSERDCVHPAASWSTDLRAAVTKLTTKCASKLAGPLDQPVMLDYYTWLLTAAIQAFVADPNLDFVAVMACLDATACDDDKTNLLTCFFAP